MDFEGKYIGELIELREESRKNKNWELSDEIRDYLDTKLAFIFDTKAGQEIYYLNEYYFRNQEQEIETVAMSRRQFVEHRIKQDIKAEKDFESWLYSIQKSAGIK